MASVSAARPRAAGASTVPMAMRARISVTELHSMMRSCPLAGIQREHAGITRGLIGLDCIARCVATLRRPWQARRVALSRFDDVLDRLENLDVGPAAADIAVGVMTSRASAGSECGSSKHRLPPSVSTLRTRVSGQGGGLLQQRQVPGHTLGPTSMRGVCPVFALTVVMGLPRGNDGG
jgi:hypothetical protein